MLYVLDQISLSYELGHRKISILNDFNMEVLENDFLAIMGPSGSGKTSILNILAGFLSPSNGQVLFENENLYGFSRSRMSRYRNSEIGMVHQFFNLISCFDTMQNVAAPLLIAGVKKKEAYIRAEIVLERFGMLGRSRHYPNELSGGEQQRVAIARALINKPKVILADEPTGNLDRSNTQEVLDIFSEIHQKGTAIVMITHDPVVADRAARVVSLEKSLCSA